MTIAEWSTIASLATALGTLILAVATFSAVRSSNLMARRPGRRPWTVELLYADHEGGQRAISRFMALPVEHQIVMPPGDHHEQAGTAGSGWLTSASRHWSLDRPDER